MFPGFAIFWLFLAACWLSSCASSLGVSAEEYFSMGMAYFELGKYEEAEKWLNRARAIDKTKAASEYNLGRIAFETGRYVEAARLFERILHRDPENILALKAAAYTRIKLENLEEAEALYERVLALIPDSVDDGHNHALVLFAMKKYEKAEEVLLNYRFTLEDNKEALLLLGRTQKALNKPEAIDTYAKWLGENQDNQVRYEYAQVLEQGEFYAKALEEYKTLLDVLPPGPAPAAGESQTISKPGIRFIMGRLLLIADPESEEGINELTLAVTGGFSDIEALESLTEDSRILDAKKDEIRRIVHNIKTGNTGTETPAAGGQIPFGQIPFGQTPFDQIPFEENQEDETASGEDKMDTPGRN
jgi:tetratricopeptide (TPR) repeat protein